MNTEKTPTERLARLQKLLNWVNEGYRNALQLYGPTHPLTRSWLKEKNDIEWFTAHEADTEQQSPA